MFSFLKRLTRKRRDLDYRGVSTSVNWLKLGYMARTRKPGALEILQDMIETHFPKQFRVARYRAKKKFKEWFPTMPEHMDVFVYFDYTMAHRRFRPNIKTKTNPKTGKKIKFRWSKRSLPKSVSPFWTGAAHTKTGKFPGDGSGDVKITGDVIVWSVRLGKNLGNIR